MWLVSWTAGLQGASDQHWLVLKLFLNWWWWSFSTSVAWQIGTILYIYNAKMGCISCSFLLRNELQRKMQWGQHKILLLYWQTIIVCEVQQYKWRYSRPVYIHCISCICGLLAMNQPQFCKFYFEMKMDSMWEQLITYQTSSSCQGKMVCIRVIHQSHRIVGLRRIRNLMVAGLPAC
jgi:hypothetical protein